MIQRIQTIFMILAAMSFGALLKLPFATSDKPAAQFLSDKIYDIRDHVALLIVACLGAGLSLISIFLYKNRKLQLKLGYLTIIMAIFLPIVAFLLFTNESKNINSTVQVHDQLGIYLPVAAILFSALANYYIRKNDKLVK